MTDKMDATAKNRRQLIAIFAISLVTVGGAYLLFYSAREGEVWNTTNNGTFVVPPLAVADIGLVDESGVTVTEGETWWMWVVAPDGCGSGCEEALYQLRQLHVLLNKDADRVRRAIVTRGERPAAAAEYPKLAHLTGDHERLAPGLYIVDPIGNLVLHYPYADAGKPLLDDLKRLLKLSQIG
jgi:cytochrome oxidase Cu insertion factor (SCO1/SenC/PrrC family)